MHMRAYVYVCIRTHTCIRIRVYTHNVTIALQLHVHMHGGMCITLCQLPQIGVAIGIIQTMQHKGISV